MKESLFFGLCEGIAAAGFGFLITYSAGGAGYDLFALYGFFAALLPGTLFYYLLITRPDIKNKCPFNSYCGSYGNRRPYTDCLSGSC